MAEDVVVCVSEVVYNLRYAEDTLIIAADQLELETVITRLTNTSNYYGLRLNISKTKLMIVYRADNNSPHITQVAGIEVVNKLIYLGASITNTSGSEVKIKSRLAMARTATTTLSRVWRDTAISKATKLKLVNALIFPIATYAAEIWTMKQADRSRIEAFEMWVYGRMLRLSWTEHMTNISILNELKIRTRLSKSISQKYLQYFGHISRRADGVEKLMVQGKVNRRRKQGRSPSRWVNQSSRWWDRACKRRRKQHRIWRHGDTPCN